MFVKQKVAQILRSLLFIGLVMNLTSCLSHLPAKNVINPIKSSQKMTQYTLSKDPKANRDLVIHTSRAYFKNPIIADLVAAQAILEAGFNDNPKYRTSGGSDLAIKHSNLFGIKARAFEQNEKYSVKLLTFEYIHGRKVQITAWFRKFDSLNECFARRAELFNLPRYKNLYSAKSFEEAAVMIQKDGYATDPAYSKLLISTYNKYIK